VCDEVYLFDAVLEQWRRRCI